MVRDRYARVLRRALLITGRRLLNAARIRATDISVTRFGDFKYLCLKTWTFAHSGRQYRMALILETVLLVSVRDFGPEGTPYTVLNSNKYLF